jgi:hypothetical protein
MKTSILILALLFVCSVNGYSSHVQTYEELRTQLQELKPDPNKIAIIEGMFWEQDGGYISLESGKMYFFTPINNRVCVAVYIGEGSFSYTPSTLVEKLQLERFYDTQTLEKKIVSMVLYFTDSTYDFIRHNFPIQPGEIDEKVQSTYKSSLDYIITGKNNLMNPNIVKAFLEDKNTGLFFAQLNNFESVTKNSYFWIKNPVDEEEINFCKANWQSGYGNYIDLINEYHCNQELDNDSLRNCKKDEIKIEKYKIDCNIGNGLEFSCKTKVDFTSLTDSIKWIHFSLYDKLNVDSIVDEQENHLYFFKAKESSIIWVRLDHPLTKNTKYSMTFSYGGKYIEFYVVNTLRNEEWLELESSIEWYPAYDYKQRAYFDITYTRPKRYKFCSVGEKKSEELVGDFIKNNWVTKKRIRNASFNIGDFTEKIIPGDTLSPELVFYFKNPDQVDAVSSDIKLSIGFFNNLFGENITDRFYVSEIPGSYGEAFSNMLNLSYSTFLSNSKKGFNESFCSHEVSHQWWAVAVDFISYRDQWLSEGFAEYSSLMYTQMVLKDNDKFLSFLDRSKEHLMNLRKSWIYDGIKAGPISLGGRNNSEATRGDYQTIIYEKGSWVLHMLRNMLIDFNTMDESLFMGILKEFFQTYKDSSARTEDFIRIVNKHVGMDMSWFFTQWVDRNEIPVYTFGYKTEKTAEGKFKVTGRIKQSGVPEGFMMSVPVKVDFGDDKYTIMRLNITKPYLEFEFPLFSMEPQKLNLNVYNSVLCGVEDDDFEDIKP